MQFLGSSLLLIQCTLVLSVYSQCVPGSRECLECNDVESTDACVLSADNKTVECQIPTSGCRTMTCLSPFDTCMAGWQADNAGVWTITAGCLSSSNPCPYDTDTCEHIFDTSQTIPSTLATGFLYCRCYEDFCNQNFSADISEFYPPTSTNTLTPTPTVVDERDCINCQGVNPICDLSEDNRTLECFFDDECTKNTIRCSSMERCSVIWRRQDTSSPWHASAGCLGGSGGAVSDQPNCEVIEDYFKDSNFPIPESVETGLFVCTCLGGLCNREFKIDLNNFTSSDTTITSVPPTTSTSLEGSFTLVPTTTSTNSSPNVTVTTGSNVNTDGMSVFIPVLFITYGLLFAYQYTDNLYTNQFEIQLSTIRV